MVPLLQQALPNWQTSHEEDVIIAGALRNVWIVSGGTLRQAGDDPLIGVLIDLEPTLVYLEVQNASEADALGVVAGLELVKVSQED